MAKVEIGLMTMSDVPYIAQIEKDTFSTPWTREDLIRELRENQCARYIVLREDGIPVAYAGVWLVIDEGHIVNIAVRSDRRRLGYGEKVVRAMMQLAADTGIVYMTLEVRRSNLVAQHLYRKAGFVELGVRKRYYTDTGEDALIYVCDSMPEPHPDDDPFLIREQDGPEEIQA